MIETDMAGPIVAKMDAAVVESMRPHFVRSDPDLIPNLRLRWLLVPSPA